jgi:hypothetical protein
LPRPSALDIAIHEFDPGIPVAIAEDTEALDKKRIYPEVRKAETRLLATRLKSTLESSGNGAPCASCRRALSSSM